MLSYQITGFQICVPLSEKQWNRLMVLEQEVEEPGSYEFIKALEAVGASRVDWSGHYGRNLFFNAEADFDTSEYGRSVVERVVNKIEELLV